jgi:Type I restriction enzyme R protein N terminus (HSDR_N)
MKKVCPRFKHLEEKLSRMDDVATPAVEKQISTLTDYLTGEEIQDIGAEANRQAVMKFLVEEKGYDKTDLEADRPVAFAINGEPYASKVDLVVSAGGLRLMVVKCAAGSLGSREREAISGARLADTHPIPIAIVSDGNTATVLDALTGKKIATGLDAVPSKEALGKKFDPSDLQPLPKNKIERERLVFRTYDTENVNVVRD